MGAVDSSGRPGQLAFDFDPGLTERYTSLLDCVRACAYASPRPLKAIAADMDLPLSTLSRKLSAHPDDPRHLTVEDLESFLQATGDVTPIKYLVARYLQSADDRRQRALDALAALAPAITELLHAVQR